MLALAVDPTYTFAQSVFGGQATVLMVVRPSGGRTRASVDRNASRQSWSGRPRHFTIGGAADRRGHRLRRLGSPEIQSALERWRSQLHDVRRHGTSPLAGTIKIVSPEESRHWA